MKTNSATAMTRTNVTYLADDVYVVESWTPETRDYVVTAAIGQVPTSPLYDSESAARAAQDRQVAGMTRMVRLVRTSDGRVSSRHHRGR